ncbi:MAG: patatin-like phospholipase family protein [Saprospiraceae bacterium]|nr:patatin-like phospholipase family protein [Saprospiraceae bacterium]
MRALVISGGGAKGAFAGGLAEYLIKEEGKEYDLFLGTSTGSLLVTHLAIGQLDRLKKVFTSVTQNDVFDVCPFVLSKEAHLLKARINHWNVLWQFIKGKRTFGESCALRDLIARTLTKEDFSTAKKGSKKVAVTVSNLTRNVVESKYLSDYDYEDFVDWIWCSCNMVPFMSLVEKNGFEYADGGFGNLIPIQEAIASGAKEIDVIVLSPRHRIVHKKRNSNAFGVLLSAFDFMLDQIRYDDILMGHMEGIYNNIEVKFWHTPRMLTQNSFIFNPDIMKEWWQEGLEMGREISRTSMGDQIIPRFRSDAS